MSHGPHGSRVVTGSLGRSINVEKEQLATVGKMLTGRQSLLMIHNHYRATEVDDHIWDLDDLITTKLVGNDLRRLYDEWEMTRTGIR